MLWGGAGKGRWVLCKFVFFFPQISTRGRLTPSPAAWRPHSAAKKNIIEHFPVHKSYLGKTWGPFWGRATLKTQDIPPNLFRSGLLFQLWLSQRAPYWPCGFGVELGLVNEGTNEVERYPIRQGSGLGWHHQAGRWLRSGAVLGLEAGGAKPGKNSFWGTNSKRFPHPDPILVETRG